MVSRYLSISGCSVVVTRFVRGEETVSSNLTILTNAEVTELEYVLLSESRF